MNTEKLTNLIYQINEPVLQDLMHTTNHIDDTMIYTFIKAYFLSSTKFYLIKLNKMDIWNIIYDKYINIFITTCSNMMTNYNNELSNNLLEYFKIAFDLIDVIYQENFDNIVDFLSLCNIRKSILKQLKKILDSKNNTNIKINIDAYNIAFTGNFDIMEDLLIEL